MPLPLALAPILFEAAPALMRLVTGSDRATEISEKVVDLAVATLDVDRASPTLEADITGAMETNPEAVIAFRTRLRELEHAELELTLADLANARKRDLAMQQLGGNMRANLIAAAVFLGIFACVGLGVWLSVYAPPDAPRVGEAMTLVGTIAGVFVRAGTSIIDFEFGSSRGSKEKSRQIDALAKRP